MPTNRHVIPIGLLFARPMRTYTPVMPVREVAHRILVERTRSIAATAAKQLKGTWAQFSALTVVESGKPVEQAAGTGICSSPHIPNTHTQLEEAGTNK